MSNPRVRESKCPCVQESMCAILHVSSWLLQQMCVQFVLCSSSLYVQSYSRSSRHWRLEANAMLQCGGAEWYPWPRAGDRTSCCHKCRHSRGRRHAPYCISRIQPNSSRVTIFSSNIGDADMTRRQRDRGHARDRAQNPRRELSANADASRGNQAAQCVVCLVANVTHALVPCGHMCVCEECASIAVGHMSKCPICRAQVYTSMRIYLS